MHPQPVRDLAVQPLCPGRGACGLWLAAAVLFTEKLADAQQALRSSLAGEAAAQAGALQTASMPYTVKSGDFRLLVTPSMEADWNDNVYLSNTNAQSDFILMPRLGLNASYPVTQRNLLQLNVTAGYQEYLEHHDLSALYVQSGSALSFDIYVKDFWINLHDRFSYVQDSASQAAVANTGSFGLFQNTAGLNTTWDLEDVTLSLGYDYQISRSTASQFALLDSTSDLVVGRAGLRLHPTLTAGVEGTAAFMTYDQLILDDNVNYSAGMYADWRPGSALQIKPRVGYTIMLFEHTSQFIQTANVATWYADLTITHQVSTGVSYSFSAGHEEVPAILANVLEDYYVRPTINWNIIKNLTLATSLFYELGNQGVGNVRGNLVENFDWYGGALSLSHPLTSRLTIGLNYRLTLRSSDIASNEYAQNQVGLLINYHP